MSNDSEDISLRALFTRALGNAAKAHDLPTIEDATQVSYGYAILCVLDKDN